MRETRRLIARASTYPRDRLTIEDLNCAACARIEDQGSDVLRLLIGAIVSRSRKKRYRVIEPRDLRGSLQTRSIYGAGCILRPSLSLSLSLSLFERAHSHELDATPLCLPAPSRFILSAWSRPCSNAHSRR